MRWARSTGCFTQRAWKCGKQQGRNTHISQCPRLSYEGTIPVAMQWMDATQLPTSWCTRLFGQWCTIAPAITGCPSWNWILMTAWENMCIGSFNHQLDAYLVKMRQHRISTTKLLLSLWKNTEYWRSFTKFTRN